MSVGFVVSPSRAGWIQLRICPHVKETFPFARPEPTSAAGNVTVIPSMLPNSDRTLSGHLAMTSFTGTTNGGASFNRVEIVRGSDIAGARWGAAVWRSFSPFSGGAMRSPGCAPFAAGDGAKDAGRFAGVAGAPDGLARRMTSDPAENEGIAPRVRGGTIGSGVSGASASCIAGSAEAPRNVGLCRSSPAVGATAYGLSLSPKTSMPSSASSWCR